MLSDEQYKAIRKAEYDAWCKGDDGDQYRRIAEYAYAAGQRAAFEEAVVIARKHSDGPDVGTWEACVRVVDDIERRVEDIGK